MLTEIQTLRQTTSDLEGELKRQGEHMKSELLAVGKRLRDALEKIAGHEEQVTQLEAELEWAKAEAARPGSVPPPPPKGKPPR